MALKDYSTTPANNNAAPPNGAPEGMAAAAVNDVQRQVMADVKDGVALTIDTIALLRLVDVTKVSDGNRATVSESATNGDALGGSFKYVLASTATDDGFNVVAPASGSGRWVRDNNAVQVGNGVKGNPQTNVAIQVIRDIAGTSASSQGVIVADFFAEDLLALNPFGSDVQIGDGTQSTEVLNHVNSFQSTNKIDLNTATLSTHRAFIAQDVMVSGTVSAQTCFGAIDMLGVRDTPGFGVSGFNPASVVNNQIGIATTIRHGSNPRSAHFAAGSTDAGATLTSGAAVIDCEGPIVNRQNTASTSKTTGALIFTLGGIGCAGDIWQNAAFVSNADATYSMNSVAGTQLAKLNSTASLTSLTNVHSGILEFGVSNAAELRLLSDRLIPVTDSNLNLGDATHKWLEIFADNAVINTSDETTKTNILPIDDALLDAWEDVQAIIFQFKDAVKLKGAAKARLHSGYIAQQVQAALEAKGLDGFRYALLCKDELTHKVTKTRIIIQQKTEMVETKVVIFEKNVDGKLIRKVITETNKTPMTEQHKVYNEDGSEYLQEVAGKGFVEMRPIMQDHPVMEEIQEEYEVEEFSGKFLMGLRYGECAVVEAAYLRREIQRLKA